MILSKEQDRIDAIWKFEKVAQIITFKITWSKKPVLTKNGHVILNLFDERIFTNVVFGFFDQ